MIVETTYSTLALLDRWHRMLTALAGTPPPPPPGPEKQSNQSKPPDQSTTQDV